MQHTLFLRGRNLAQQLCATAIRLLSASRQHSLNHPAVTEEAAMQVEAGYTSCSEEATFCCLKAIYAFFICSSGNPPTVFHPQEKFPFLWTWKSPEKQTLAVRSSEVSVKPRSCGKYLEFLGNAGQFNCQFSDLDKLKRSQGAHPSPRPQGLANSGSDDFWATFPSSK